MTFSSWDLKKFNDCSVNISGTDDFRLMNEVFGFDVYSGNNFNQNKINRLRAKE